MKKLTKYKNKTLLLDKPVNEEMEVEHTGKTPPNALDLESKILGSILIDNNVINDVFEIIDSRHFYRKKNEYVFDAIKNLDQKKEPIDPSTLKEELQLTGKLDIVGGIEYIIDLTSSISTSANAKYYSRIVLEKYLLRNLISISSGIADKCFNPESDTFSILDEAEQRILDVSESLSKKKVISVKDEIDNIINMLAEQKENKSGLVGIPTGYSRLDDLTAGFQDSELIIIAGRPSHGKTAFSMNIARNAAIDHGKSVAIFSLEMSFRELILRMLSGEARVNGKNLKTGKTTTDEWNRVIKSFHKLKTNLFIDDTSELSILEIRAKARKMKKEFGIDMIIVDYLQLVKGPESAERRDLEVAYVSRGLKALAKELEIPVVACAQLNRSIEQRGKEKRPQLADLRESGSIEQDADVVIFVHRPAMGKSLNRDDPDYLTELRKAEIIIGKQRNGPIDDFELVFLNEYAKFENQEYHPVIEIPGYVKSDDPF
ncbi:MAG TPA: replicative DNA helicase [Ignavibacteria bacterium]|nr:replicative DNA helicase [Bacteroidota bacterium]HRI85377.1 replicative DNA helicase [Ignavibacteria bacterium]HRJ99580.1 replicative DNA helicase [Ignavibacteria bacterium]